MLCSPAFILCHLRRHVVDKTKRILLTCSALSTSCLFLARMPKVSIRSASGSRRIPNTFQRKGHFLLIHQQGDVATVAVTVLACRQSTGAVPLPVLLRRSLRCFQRTLKRYYRVNTVRPNAKITFYCSLL